MTDEDAFQSWLDAHPDDHTCRLVFADWLQERIDVRAEGYRALGALRLIPLGVTITHDARGEDLVPYRGRLVWVYGAVGALEPGPHLLPKSWKEKISVKPPSDLSWRRFLSRREAEDAAALAFSLLPPERRAELLASSTLTPSSA
jgi:uncharacterized protein (TIGR02996 family)